MHLTSMPMQVTFWTSARSVGRSVGRKCAGNVLMARLWACRLLILCNVGQQILFLLHMQTVGMAQHTNVRLHVPHSLHALPSVEALLNNT